MGSIIDKIKSDVQDAVAIAALGAGAVLGDAVIEGVDKATQAAAKGLSKAKDAAGEAVQDIKEKGYDLKRSKMADEKKVVYLEIHSISEDSAHPYEIFDKKGNLIYLLTPSIKRRTRISPFTDQEIMSLEQLNEKCTLEHRYLKLA